MEKLKMQNKGGSDSLTNQELSNHISELENEVKASNSGNNSKKSKYLLGTQGQEQ